MQPMPGVRLTLICQDVSTPYSGMLPGYIAGRYTFDQAHIDLRPLCHFAGARFYGDQVTGLDLAEKRILCRNRPPVAFDLLSINTGSTPRSADVPGAAEFALPVKPIDQFLKGWEQIIALALQAGRPQFRVAIVGGGAGGVELVLAARHRLQSLLAERGPSAPRMEFDLIAETDTLLPTHNRRVQSKFKRILQEREVHVHLNHHVVQVESGVVRCSPGSPVDFDALLWVTTAAPESWIARSGLETDKQGFVAVNECLQSVSHPFVFAAGDIAAVREHPRPKSGVFAVRQGPPLARNLRLALTGKPPQPFQPQKAFLSLISTGDRYAVASRGPWAFEGKRVWILKDWIDRRWMEQYQTLPEMKAAPPIAPAQELAGTEVLRELSAVATRCGGCGAKVGSTILSRVLQRLKPVERDDILVGLNSADDAAVTLVPPGMASVQTVDFFRSFIDDPYLFGKVAAHHGLGDIFAMGAAPQSALAIALVPFGLESKMEEQLYQMMAGALEVLAENGTALTGGHTGEGPELAFGLAVSGIVDPKRLLRKGGMQPGDRLILTKPLGTGTLFAADMRGKAKGRWIEAALASMLVSNRAAAQCFLRHRATACTDVTGFGLLGHLAEMVRASKVEVELLLPSVPVLEGVRETLAAGMVSSLHPQNLQLSRAIRNPEEAVRHDRYPALFDPQTAGGLLASVPAGEADACLIELQRLGYSLASLIGTVSHLENESAPVTIRS